MKRTRLLTKATAVAVISTFALSGCGNAQNATGPSVPDTITAEVEYASRDFNPNSTSSAMTMAANWYVVEPLYAFNYSDYSMYNALAKGEPVKVSDTEYTVALRDGAKFSDGKPVTANDVVKSYERSNKEGGLYSPMISFIDSVEAKTDQEVTFNLKYPFPAFKERLALIKVAPASMSNDELTAQPIGSGPWKYANITDQKVTFVKNDLYNCDYPAQCKNMVWNVAVDDTARVTAMQTGKVDVMELVPTLAFDVLQKKAELKTVQSFNAPYIMFNTKQKPFDDPRVRQAVFYAIDAKQLIDNQMAGQATPTTSYLIEEYPAYHKASTVFEHNVGKAKQLLEEAGVQTPIKFTLYSTDQSWITQLAPQIKNNLAEIGMDVDLQSMASSALYPNITDRDDADFSMALVAGDPSVFGNDADLLMNWFYGDNTWTHQRTFWYGSDGYKQLHELMDKAIAAPSDSERQDYWDQCFDLLSEQVPIYPLFHRKTTTAFKKGVFSKTEAIGTTGLDLLQAKLNH